jgi:glutathione peroxidase
MQKLKKFFIVTIITAIVFAGYVEIVNINKKNMTYRQKVLKAFYPALMWLNKLTGSKTKEEKQVTLKAPPVSFYTLRTPLGDGSTLNFETLKGKKVLLVNTASNCGYTPQYEALQQLSEKYKKQLVIIGFPANDFKEQEKGNDADIASFCKLNFGVSFPLASKSVVVKTTQQNLVFNWLTHATQNGWNEQAPSWNFSKYLVNENGILTHYFDPAIDPMSDAVTKAIGEKAGGLQPH